MSPVSAAAAAVELGLVRRGHVVGRGHLAVGVQGVGLHAEADLRLVGLGQAGQEAQEPGAPADPQHQDAGGHRIERARSGRSSGCRGCPRHLATTSWLVHPEGLSITASPSGATGPVTPGRPGRRPVGRRLASARSTWRSRGGSPRSAGPRSARRPGGTGSGGSGGPEPDGSRPAGSANGPPRGPPATSSSRSSASACERRVEHLGVVERTVDLDRGDRHQLQPIVADAFEFGGDDLAHQLADAVGPLEGLRVGSCVPRSALSRGGFLAGRRSR